MAQADLANRECALRSMVPNEHAAFKHNRFYIHHFNHSFSVLSCDGNKASAARPRPAIPPAPRASQRDHPWIFRSPKHMDCSWPFPHERTMSPWRARTDRQLDGFAPIRDAPKRLTLASSPGPRTCRHSSRIPSSDSVRGSSAVTQIDPPVPPKFPPSCSVSLYHASQPSQRQRSHGPCHHASCF